MRILYGKGVWALEERDLPRAIEMANAIGGRVILFRTGQEGQYLDRPAQRALKRISDAGMIPLGSPVITCHDPDVEADAAIQALLDGYVGLVFDIGKSASWQYAGASRLGKRMLETQVPQEVLFFTSLPNISANLDIPYAEMSRFCQGGFMPQAYASYRWNARYTLDVVAYREFRLWTEAHETELPIYPVLGLSSGRPGQAPMTIGQIRSWCEVLSRYQPPFFSVYHVGTVPEVVWPLLGTIEMTPAGQEPSPAPPIEGHYVTVHPGETVSHLCTQHSCTVEDFWSWNGHLWDSQGKPREPELLEYGWIVRVQ